MARQLTCPAAVEVNPPAHGRSVLCGVLHRSNDDAELNGFRQRGQVAPLISAEKDPRQIEFFCAGRGVPGSPTSYCACLMWRAQRDMEIARRRELRDERATRPPAREGSLSDLYAELADKQERRMAAEGA